MLLSGNIMLLSGNVMLLSGNVMLLFGKDMLLSGNGFFVLICLFQGDVFSTIIYSGNRISLHCKNNFLLFLYVVFHMS